MPDGIAILLGGLIGGPLMMIVINLQYHLVRRINNKEKDKQLRERLKKIEGEVFDFEKEK